MVKLITSILVHGHILNLLYFSMRRWKRIIRISWYIQDSQMKHFGFVWFSMLYMKLLTAHHNDVIMRTMASQITSPTIFYLALYPGSYQRTFHSSASLAFVQGIHRRPLNSPHKRPTMRKMFPLDDVIMRNMHTVCCGSLCLNTSRF